MAAVLDAPLGALFEAGRTKAAGAISMALRAAPRCTSDGDGGRRRCCWRPTTQMEMEAGMELSDTSWAGAERTEEGVLCKSRVGVAGVYLQNVFTSAHSPWMKILWC